MINTDITFVSFLILCVSSLAGFSFWLVKKILIIVKNVTECVKELKMSVDKQNSALEKNNIILDNYITLQKHNIIS